MTTDTERLDYLQAMLSEGEYSGRCVLRWSGFGRGMRLHETQRPRALDSVRDAIDAAMSANLRTRGLGTAKAVEPGE